MPLAGRGSRSLRLDLGRRLPVPKHLAHDEAVTRPGYSVLENHHTVPGLLEGGEDAGQGACPQQPYGDGGQLTRASIAVVLVGLQQLKQKRRREKGQHRQ